jgi:hypothetical protein
MGLGRTHKRKFKMKSTCTIKKEDDSCKLNGSGVMNLVETTSNTSFTWPKIGTFVVRKFWTFISFSNQFFLENVMAIFYSFQKILSNSVWQTPIKPHLTPNFKGYMVGNQILNLTFIFFLYHNSCKSGLNEPCEGTLSIFVSRHF